MKPWQPRVVALGMGVFAVLAVANVSVDHSLENGPGRAPVWLSVAMTAWGAVVVVGLLAWVAWLVRDSKRAK